jgi:hypothetical protein
MACQWNVNVEPHYLLSLLCCIAVCLVGVGPLSYGLTTNKVSVTVSAEHIKTFYGAKIMPKHRRLSDFFPNLNHFKDLVTNTKKTSGNSNKVLLAP